MEQKAKPLHFTEDKMFIHKRIKNGKTICYYCFRMTFGAGLRKLMH